MLACLAGLALLAFGAGTAPAARAGARNCSTITAAMVKSTLGLTVTPGTGGSTSSFGGLSYTGCSLNSAAVVISFITPDTSSGYAKLLAMLKKATVVTNVSGIGTLAFSGTGSSTSSVFKNGKSTTTTSKTENLWVYAAGKAMFEISVSNGSVAKDEALAKAILK